MNGEIYVKKNKQSRGNFRPKAHAYWVPKHLSIFIKHTAFSSAREHPIIADNSPFLCRGGKKLFIWTAWWTQDIMDLIVEVNTSIFKTNKRKTTQFLFDNAVCRNPQHTEGHMAMIGFQVIFKELTELNYLCLIAWGLWGGLYFFYHAI